MRLDAALLQVTKAGENSLVLHAMCFLACNEAFWLGIRAYRAPNLLRIPKIGHVFDRSS